MSQRSTVGTQTRTKHAHVFSRVQHHQPLMHRLFATTTTTTASSSTNYWCHPCRRPPLSNLEATLTPTQKTTALPTSTTTASHTTAILLLHQLWSPIHPSGLLFLTLRRLEHTAVPTVTTTTSSSTNCSHPSHRPPLSLFEDTHHH